MKTQTVRVLKIPLRQAPRTDDPLACALRVGADKQDVVVGKNGGGTSFQVVAEDDPAGGRLRLYLQAHDVTLCQDSSPGGDYASAEIEGERHVGF